MVYHIRLFIETSAFISAGKNAPFWLLFNHWYNVNYSVGAKSIFDTVKKIDYGYGIEIMNINIPYIHMSFI